MANEYISAEQLKATLELTNEAFADADVTYAVAAASRAVDEICGRRFYVNTNDETRYFDIPPRRYPSPFRDDHVRVPDVVSITSLQTDPSGDNTFPDTWTVNTDYVLEPLNAAVDGKPYQWIRRHPRGSLVWPSYGYPRSIKIVGKFGWSTTPAQVIDATTILASRLLKRKREAPFGVVTVGLEVGAAVTIGRMDPDVSVLLQPFMVAGFA